jgi:hypothetical protein
MSKQIGVALCGIMFILIMSALGVKLHQYIAWGGSDAASVEARLTRLEALHENEKGAAVHPETRQAEEIAEGRRSVIAAPASTRKGFSSTHDMMLDKFTVEHHNHGKTACTFHTGGYLFTFRWDGERWEQVEATRED